MVEVRKFMRGLLDELPSGHPDRQAIESIAREVDDYIAKARRRSTAMYVVGNIAFVENPEGIITQEADLKTGLVRTCDSKGNRASYFFGLKE